MSKYEESRTRPCSLRVVPVDEDVVPRKTLKRCQLLSKHVSEIISSVQESKLSHKEAARKHRVSVTLVQSLVTASKKDPDFVQHRAEKEQQRRFKLRVVVEHANQHLQSQGGLQKSQHVADSIRQQHGVVVKPSYVSQVLRHDLGARYERLRKVPSLSNASRCLLLRQHYAKFMLAQLAAGVRIINVDQSWMSETNFTRCKWRMRGQRNTSADKKVSPRIAMQVAVCTDGRLYCSLTQVNTTSKVFCAFVSRLAAKLTEEDRDWRTNSILLLDGARY